MPYVELSDRTPPTPPFPFDRSLLIGRGRRRRARRDGDGGGDESDVAFGEEAAELLCRIDCQGAYFLLIALTDPSRIRLNGRTVTAAPLRDGDTIEVGGAALRFRTAGVVPGSAGEAGETEGTDAPAARVAARRSHRLLAWAAAAALAAGAAAGATAAWEALRAH